MTLPPYRPRAVGLWQSPAETFHIAAELIEYLQMYAASLPDWERRLAAVEEYVELRRADEDGNYEDRDA